jgi:hypothetical protein
VLELLHVPIYLLGHYTHTLPDLGTILPSSPETPHVMDACKSTLSLLLKSLEQYMSAAAPPARLGELIVTNLSSLAEHDAIMALVETGTRTPGLTPAKRAVPAIRYAAKLSNICARRKVRFEIRRNNSKALGHLETFRPV